MGIPRREQGDWSEIITSYLENSKSFGPEDPELSSKEDASDQLRLIRIFLTVAVEQAKARYLTPADSEALKLLDEAYECATSITYAFTAPLENETDTGRVHRAFRMSWSARPGNLLHEARRIGSMEVSAADLENGIGGYLRSSFRDKRIDRVLIKALADTELSSFLWLQIGPGIPLLKSPLEEAREGVIWPWVKTTLKRFAIMAAVCAALIALNSYLPATPDWLVLGGIGLFTIGYILLTVISLIALVIHGPKLAETRKSAMETIRAAIDFYTEFHSTGTISLPHYRKRVEEARQKGIVWPQTLWALIEDMEQRNVRMF